MKNNSQKGVFKSKKKLSDFIFPQKDNFKMQQFPAPNMQINRAQYYVILKERNTFQ